MESTLNPKVAFTVLAKEIGKALDRSDKEATLSGILAAQIARQSAELSALRADVEQAVRVIEEGEPPQQP